MGVTASHHTNTAGFHWPVIWSEFTFLEKTEENACSFEDDPGKDADAIVLCAGYLLHPPFLPDDRCHVTQTPCVMGGGAG